MLVRLKADYDQRNFTTIDGSTTSSIQNNMASTVRFLGSRLANLGLLFERNLFGLQNARGIKQSN